MKGSKGEITETGTPGRDGTLGCSSEDENGTVHPWKHYILKKGTEMDKGYVPRDQGVLGVGTRRGEKEETLGNLLSRMRTVTETY